MTNEVHKFNSLFSSERVITEAVEQNSLIISRKSCEKTQFIRTLIYQVGYPAIIIVPNHQVALQQYNELRKTGLDIKTYYDNLLLPETFDVIITTRIACSRLITSGKFSGLAWSTIKLVVIDQVSNVKTKNPQAQLVKNILNEGFSPRIIAFTSSLPDGKIASEILSSLLRTCRTLNIENTIYSYETDKESIEKQSSEPSTTVLKHTSKPIIDTSNAGPSQELWRKLSGKIVFPIGKYLYMAILKLEAYIQEEEKINPLPFRDNIALDKWDKVFKVWKENRSSFSPCLMLFVYLCQAIKIYLNLSKTHDFAIALYLQMNECEAIEIPNKEVTFALKQLWQLLPRSTATLNELDTFLKEKFNTKSTFRGLIIVSRRTYTYLLKYYLENRSVVAEHIKSVCIHSNKNFSCLDSVSREDITRRIAQFKGNIANIMISTFIVEGDIGEIDDIIYFDRLPSLKNLTKRKELLRKEDSEPTMMNFAYKEPETELQTSSRIEDDVYGEIETLKKLIQSCASNRSEDVTPKGCNLLIQVLTWRAFRYERNDIEYDSTRYFNYICHTTLTNTTFSFMKESDEAKFEAYICGIKLEASGNGPNEKEAKNAAAGHAILNWPDILLSRLLGADEIESLDVDTELKTMIDKVKKDLIIEKEVES